MYKRSSPCFDEPTTDTIQIGSLPAIKGLKKFENLVNCNWMELKIEPGRIDFFSACTTRTKRLGKFLTNCGEKLVNCISNLLLTICHTFAVLTTGISSWFLPGRRVLSACHNHRGSLMFSSICCWISLALSLLRRLLTLFLKSFELSQSAVKNI